MMNDERFFLSNDLQRKKQNFSFIVHQNYFAFSNSTVKCRMIGNSLVIT